MTKINEATAAKKLWQYMRLLRVHQYVKNFFIFLPAFFAIRIIDFEIVRDATLAFVSFSFVASSIYIFNDLRDRKSDKLHPSKKFRPLITGEVSINLAVLFLFLLAFSGFFIGYFFLNSKFVVILIIYLTINVVYSLGGKHIAILDLLFISSGFVLRLLAGTHYGAIDRVFPSKWIIIMTFLLAMFIAFAKRRSDVLIKNQDHIKTRKSIDGYNLEFINAAMSIMADSGEEGAQMVNVATKIKELANESTKSTLIIEKEIKDIQDKSDDAVNVINGISKIINKIFLLVDTISNSANEQTESTARISSNVNMVSNGVKDIALSIKEISDGASELSRSTEEGAVVTTNIADNIREIYKKATDSKLTSEQVNLASEDLAKIASQLLDMVMRFNV